jgi:hypothetical protein
MFALLCLSNSGLKFDISVKAILLVVIKVDWQCKEMMHFRYTNLTDVRYSLPVCVLVRLKPGI